VLLTVALSLDFSGSGKELFEIKCSEERKTSSISFSFRGVGVLSIIGEPIKISSGLGGMMEVEARGPPSLIVGLGDAMGTSQLDDSSKVSSSSSEVLNLSFQPSRGSMREIDLLFSPSSKKILFVSLAWVKLSASCSTTDVEAMFSEFEEEFDPFPKLRDFGDALDSLPNLGDFGEDADNLFA